MTEDARTEDETAENAMTEKAMTEDETAQASVAEGGVGRDAAVPGSAREVAPSPASGRAETAPGGASGPRGARTSRKVREGLVVSADMRQTRVVAVVERVRHPRYAKTVQRTKRLYVHDQEETAKVGDRVRVAECRPISKLKRWRLLEIVERAR